MIIVSMAVGRNVLRHIMVIRAELGTDNYQRDKIRSTKNQRTRRAVTKPLHQSSAVACDHPLQPNTALPGTYDAPRARNVSPRCRPSQHAPASRNARASVMPSQPRRAVTLAKTKQAIDDPLVYVCPTTTYEHVTFKVNQTAGMITLQPLNANSSL